MGDRDKQAQAADMDHLANGRDGMSDPALLHLIQVVEERQSNHERICTEERREAKRDRHDFRSEVALGINGLREEMRAGFTKIDGSISKVHERITGVEGRGHEREMKTWDWRLKLASAIVMLLLGTAGFLFAKIMGWA